MATTNGLTQFGQSMQELDIQIICANSPQAKKRIEQANATLQDRLGKEMHLWGILDIDNANAYLLEFREDYNHRFIVALRSDHDAHFPLLECENLYLILTQQETCTLSKNPIVQYTSPSTRSSPIAQTTPCERHRLRFVRMPNEKSPSCTKTNLSPTPSSVSPPLG